MILGNLSGGIAYFSSNTLSNDTTISSTMLMKEHYTCNIYPNPTNKNFKLTSNQNGMIKIYNLLGNILYTEVKKEQTISINTNKLKKGIYIVELNNNIQKLVIE